MLTHEQAVKNATKRQHKADKLMNMKAPFAVRLAALNALGGEGRGLRETNDRFVSWIKGGKTIKLFEWDDLVYSR